MHIDIHLGRRRVMVLVAAVVLLAAAGAAYATIPDSNGVYTACRLNGIGTIRLIDPSGPSSSLLSHCISLETQISWGQKGPKGEQGPAGANGATGATGATGAHGSKGDTGATGAQGSKGDTGATGAQGPKGDTGSAGADGAQGPKGDPGQNGDPGLPGATGAQGPKGDTGAQGANGDPGSQGPKGDTGAQGPKGDTGQTGSQGPAGPGSQVGEASAGAFVNLTSTAKKIASKTVTVSQSGYAWVTADGYCNMPDPPLNLRFMLDTSPDTFDLSDLDHIWVIDEFTTPDGLVHGSGFPQHGWHLSKIFPINAGTTTFYANGVIAWGNTTSTNTTCRGHVTVFFTTQSL